MWHATFFCYGIMIMSQYVAIKSINSIHPQSTISECWWFAHSHVTFPVLRPPAWSSKCVFVCFFTLAFALSHASLHTQLNVVHILLRLRSAPITFHAEFESIGSECAASRRANSAPLINPHPNGIWAETLRTLRFALRRAHRFNMVIDIAQGLGLGMRTMRRAWYNIGRQNWRRHE